MRITQVVVGVLIAGTAVLASVPEASTLQARQMYVSVTDAKGAPVTGLTAADFVVRIGGKDSTIISAGPAVEPLSVVVVPAGFPRSLISDARNSLRGIIAAVRAVHPESRLGLMVGDGGTPPAMRGVAERADLFEREVSRFFESPNTALLDSILVASQVLSAERGRRRVVLVLAVGGTGDGGLTPLRIAREVRGADAALWVVEVGGFGRALGSSEGRVLSEVTKASGGRHETSSLAALTATARHAIEVISAQYLVSYEPPMAGDVSTVGVRRTGLSVYAPVWAGLNISNR